MTRYRSRGGFRCLMLIPCWLAAVRMALAVLSVPLFLAHGARLAWGIVLAASVIIECAVYLMIHRCGLAGRLSCTMETIASALTRIALCICLGARFLQMRIPAGILGLLSLLGMIGRCRQIATAGVQK